jgi:hypothetical protein
VALDEMADAAPGFSRRDPEGNAVLPREIGNKFGRARKERLAIRGIGSQPPECLLVGGREAFDGPAGPDKGRESLREREADNGQGARSRPGGSSPCASKASRWAATIKSWLSTSVPSTSKMTSFTAWPARSALHRSRAGT